MMKYFLLWTAASAFGLFAMTGGVKAQEGQPPECRLLPEHKANASVAYQPGVDVHGKPVVPADLNAAPMDMGRQSVIVPLNIDLAKRLQGSGVQGLNLESTLGFLEIQPNGRVLYNGQDLTTQVYVLCDKKPQENAPSGDGQKAADSLE